MYDKLITLCSPSFCISNQGGFVSVMLFFLFLDKNNLAFYRPENSILRLLDRCHKLKGSNQRNSIVEFISQVIFFIKY